MEERSLREIRRGLHTLEVAAVESVGTNDGEIT